MEKFFLLAPKPPPPSLPLISLRLCSKSFKWCILQILLGLFLNTLSHLLLWQIKRNQFKNLHVTPSRIHGCLKCFCRHIFYCCVWKSCSTNQCKWQLRYWIAVIDKFCAKKYAIIRYLSGRVENDRLNILSGKVENVRSDYTTKGISWSNMKPLHWLYFRKILPVRN